MMQHSVKIIGNRGSALIISMLLLVAIAIIGFAAINSSTLQERVAGNQRERTSAFDAAESALRNAGVYLNNTKVSPLPVFTAPPNANAPSATPFTKGHYRMGSLPDFAAAVPSTRLTPGAKFDSTNEAVWASPEAIAFMLQNGVEFGTAATATLPPLPDVPNQPRYVIEEMTAAGERRRSYRITAVGWGRAGAVVVLQTYYTPINQDTVTL
jgi:Tfp pilus assembly protein PilX